MTPCPAGDTEQRHEHDLEVGPVGEALAQRRLAPLPLRLHLQEHRRFVELEPDVDRHHQQHEREQERDPPPPLLERLLGHRRPAEANHHQRHEEPQRRGGLDPAGVQPALLVGGVLRHVGRGAAVLAAEGQPLRQAQQHQDRGRQHPDARVGRQHADRRGRQPHHHDGDEEGVLAADQIPDAPEHQRAERPDQESGRVGGEAGEQRRRRVPLGEEQRREERRQSRVDVKVVPLEDGAERRGEDHLPRLRPADRARRCCCHWCRGHVACAPSRRSRAATVR